MINPHHFGPPRRHVRIHDHARSQIVPGDTIHPIGSRASDEQDFVVYHWSDKTDETDEIDEGWIFETLPRDVDALIVILQKSLDQYCGNNWCGADMRDEVIDYLNDLGDADDRALFESCGYIPFIQIRSVYLLPDMNTFVIHASTTIDYNLDEHGIEIVVQNGTVTFGYTGDSDLLKC